MEQNNDISFDLVNTRYINFDNVKLVIFTKLELSTSQERVIITYKINNGSNYILMPF